MMAHYNTYKIYASTFTSIVHICQPISTHGLIYVLTLFALLKYVNVLHWIVRLYGFLLNEGICLMLVIEIFYPPFLIILYSKDVYPTSSII